MVNTFTQSTLALLAAAAVVTAPVASAQPQPTAPPDFVSLSDLDPSILMDIRYDTPHNFTGDPVDEDIRRRCASSPARRPTR